MRPGIALLISLLCACGSCHGEPAPAGRRTVLLLPADAPGPPPPLPRDTVAAWVEVARTPAGRARGLMYRDTLRPDHGMLFLYPAEEIRTFWMENTKIPLSICFADRSGRILRILSMAPHWGRPGPAPTYSSGEPALYALEMERGWFAGKGVKVGDRLRLAPSLAALAAE